MDQRVVGIILLLAFFVALISGSVQFVTLTFGALAGWLLVSVILKLGK